MATYMVELDHIHGGCGGCFTFQCQSRRSSARSLPSIPQPQSRRSSSVRSLPSIPQPPIPQSQGPNKPLGNTSVEGSQSRPERAPNEKSIINSSPRVSISQNHNQGRKLSDAAARSLTTNTTSSSSSSSLSSSTNSKTVTKTNRIHERQSSFGKQIDVASERNRMHVNHSQATGILPAYSGNILQLAQTGNLKHQGKGNSTTKYLPTTTTTTKALEDNVTMGNIVRRSSDEIKFQSPRNKLNPEELKSMGNHMFKQGKHEEALALYDQAIAMDSNRAAYRSNKSAALTGLGRLLEAVLECKEALTIDPSYQRAHHRLGTLYFRLGFAEEARAHFNLSGCLASCKDITQVHALEICLSRCTEAKQLQDWATLLRQTHDAFSMGANSALQIYALQAEGLLNLQRHEEAYAAFKRGPWFDMETYTTLFGQARSTYLYLIQARICMATGRFEDAITAAQNGAKLDPSDKEVRAMVIRTRSVAVARSKGNKLFKESKFSEACNTYSEGLEYDPYNSVLLCNRAACRSKLGQFEKALEDCSLALGLQPSYSKARLRRAHCNSKMERWEASIQDYEILIRENPGDEEVGRALFEAQLQLKKQYGEGNEVCVRRGLGIQHRVFQTPNHITRDVCGAILQQVQSGKGIATLGTSLSKVEVEDHPYLAKSEAVSYIPAFKIYKNGSRIKEVPANNLELLENSVELYSKDK